MKLNSSHTLSSVVILLVLTSGGFLWSNGDGPPDAHTGAPGEGTCGDCHGNLNAGSGQIVLEAPSEFLVTDFSTAYTIRVQVKNPGLSRWGFELLAIDSQGNQAGTWTILDAARTMMSTAIDGRVYVKQTEFGSDAGNANSSLVWTAKWNTPSCLLGPVTFFACGVAANGDLDTTGDTSYCASAASAMLYEPFTCCTTPGDADHGGEVTIGDVVFLIAFIFQSGQFPPCPNEADANFDGEVDIGDAVFLIEYIFMNGNAPTCVGDCLPSQSDHAVSVTNPINVEVDYFVNGPLHRHTLTPHVIAALVEMFACQGYQLNIEISDSIIESSLDYPMTLDSRLTAPRPYSGYYKNIYGDHNNETGMSPPTGQSKLCPYGMKR